MKWATPASAGVSRREPASTYAAMDTERAAGQPGGDDARPVRQLGPVEHRARW